MSLRLISVLIGGAITILGLISLATNIFVLCILWKGELLKSKTLNSSIYIFAFVNILGNCVQVGIIGLYIGPISIIQDYLFEGGVESYENDFISIIYNGAWLQDMLTIAIIAINRFVVIVLQNDHVFTRKVIKIASIVVFIGGYLIAIVSHQLLPCCFPHVSYETYSLTLLDNGTNLMYTDIDLPIDISSSLILIICYMSIFIYFKIHNNKVTKIGVSSTEIKKQKEIRLGIQFAFLSFFLLFSWVGFTIFSLLVPETINEVRSSITFAVIIHCSTNSIIFLTINKEVKDCLKRLYKDGIFKKHNQICVIKHEIGWVFI